jgi:hypothetical protein
LLKTKQLPLFNPVDRYLRCQSHQLLGGEVWRVLSVDDCGDDFGRQCGSKKVSFVPGRVYVVTIKKS